MRIGFDAKRLFNNTTGLGNYSRSILDNLSQYYPNHEYLLFSPSTENNPLTHNYKRFFKTIEAAGTPNALWRNYFIKNDIKKQSLDIFHGLSNEIPYGLSNTKKIVTIHDLIFKKLPHTYPLIDRSIYNIKSKYACKNADAIIAISESTKRDIVETYKIPADRIQVIYQSCHPLFYETEYIFDPTIKGKYKLPKEYLLSVGSIVERKNLLNIVKALKLLPEKYKIPLVVVGQGKAYKNKVLDFIAEECMEMQVIWVQNLRSVRELKYVYQNASILIYPSLYEGFGLPVVEAMLSKTPVITSKISSLPEAAGPYSKCIDPLDVEAITQAIFEILSNTERQRQMIDNSYEYAIKHFHPKVVTKQLAELYVQFIQR